MQVKKHQTLYVKITGPIDPVDLDFIGPQDIVLVDQLEFWALGSVEVADKWCVQNNNDIKLLI